MDSSRLSEVEQAIFNLIPVFPQSISSDELVATYYSNQERLPLNARNNIVARIGGIIKKLDYAKVKEWVIEKTPRAGPTPIRYSRKKV